MGEGVCVRRAFLMDDGKGLVRVGKDARRQRASLRIVNDQHSDIRSILVSQTVDLIRVAVAFVGEAPNVVEVRALFHVVGLIGVHQISA